MNKLKAYFTNNTVFAINAIGAFITGIVVLILLIVSEINENILKEHIVFLTIITLEFLSTLFIYLSYRKHMKNETKGLLGVLLTCLLLHSIHSLKYCDFSVIAWIQTALLAVVFLNHFLINISRKSKTAQIIVNQLALIGIFLIQIYSYVASWTGTYAIQEKVFIASDLFGVVLSILTSVMALSTIVCVETKMDIHKIQREDAGWTEETGYPENYNREEYHGK